MEDEKQREAHFRIARRIYQYCRYNPVEDIERPTVPRKRTRTILLPDIQRYFAVAARDFPHYLPPCSRSI